MTYIAVVVAAGDVTFLSSRSFFFFFLPFVSSDIRYLGTCTFHIDLWYLLRLGYLGQAHHVYIGIGSGSGSSESWEDREGEF